MIKAHKNSSILDQPGMKLLLCFALIKIVLNYLFLEIRRKLPLQSKTQSFFRHTNLCQGRFFLP